MSKYKVYIMSFFCEKCNMETTIESDIKITKRPKCSSCGKLMKKADNKEDN